MREEFHGIYNGTIVTAYKQLYGWGTLNVNVWLPSLVELVGYSGNQHPNAGTYYSAMQGMNVTDENPYVDAKGGNQFAYFKQYNASGGGERIWNACNRAQSWTRSCTMDTVHYAWRTTSTQRFDWGLVTGYLAVHPAADKPLYL